MEIMEYNDVAYTSGEERAIALDTLNDSIIRDFLGNDMIVPCDACAMMDSCETSGKECSAFRNWASNGNYGLETVQKHLRLPRT